MTAQNISDMFQKMLDGLRPYLTQSPFINMKRVQLMEKMMAYVNEADGSAFYIRQEVKSELNKCVTLITNNLQELLDLNDSMEKDRRNAHRKIEELLVQKEQMTLAMEEYKRLHEVEQNKCDDWAYKCRKEKEKRRFIEGSKDLVEKEAERQKKDLHEAEIVTSQLKKDLKCFERRLEEMKLITMHKDAKHAAKLRQEEKTSQMNAEMLSRVNDEKMAAQMTLQQMNESHIEENKANMTRIQELEKLLRQSEDRLMDEQNEKQEVLTELQKKDDYMKLVEGATVNLVRQTNPGREMPSMPEDFGLSPREVTVWEQLELCRGRLSDLETEKNLLQKKLEVEEEKVRQADGMYQWIQDNEKMMKAAKNEFTILEQPNAELVAEMEEIRSDNKKLKERLSAKEKHCILAHGKIEKLQELLSSLRISDTEDAERVEVATLRHKLTQMKVSMRDMLEKAKILDLKCATQEIQLKQRDLYNESQQRLLETRNQVIEVLMLKGRDVSNIESFMGFGDIARNNEDGVLPEGLDLHRTPSTMFSMKEEQQRIRNLEQVVSGLQHKIGDCHEERAKLENTIAELELKLLRADRTKLYRTSNTCIHT